MAEIKDAQNENPKQEEKDKKKKKGVVIGVIGLAVAAAIATPLALKGCAPNEKSFTVTFLTDEEVQGFHQGNMNVKEGTTVGKLKDQLAPLDGYDFEGFFKDEACEEPFDDNEVVNDDTIIYIQYSEIQITVKFHGEVSDGEKPDAETFTIGYFDKISDFADQIPTRTKESTIGIDYEFAYWETLDHKTANLDELETGKDLYALDPDRELDLYAYFESKYVEYSLTIPKNVTVMKGNQKLTSSDTVHYNDELTIIYSGVELPEEWIASFYVDGAYETEESKYKVTGNVTIEVKEVQHRYLTFSDDHKTVTGMNKNSTETNIIIPTVYYDGTAITSIAASAFKENSNIVSVVIGENVTTVGNEAFLNCSNLLDVTVGRSVKTFGSNAFSECAKSGTVTYTGTIDQWVKITFSSARANPLFNQAQKFYVEKTKAVEGEVTINVSINSTALRGYKGEFSVVLGDGVESIGSSAFLTCRGLTSVVIGKNVTSIGTEAFRDCVGLVNVTMGDGLTSIGDGVFQNCTSLENVVIGKNVTSLGVSAFYECTGLVSVTLGESVKTIANTAFAGCTALESIVVGKSVTSFGTDAFMDCALLKTVTYTGTIDQWVKITFSSAKANPLFNAAQKFYVESTKAVEGVVTVNTNINSTAFRGYKGSFSLVLGDGAKTIGDNVFINCTGLTSVIIGKNVTSIGKEAFRDCSGLERVIIGKNVTTLGDNVFGNCPAFESIYFSGSESEFNSWSLKSSAVLGASSKNVYYYSAQNPYENGTATVGFTYWHYASDNVTPEFWDSNLQFTITFDESKISVKDSKGQPLTSGVSEVQYGDTITIEGVDVEGDWVYGISSVTGAMLSSGTEYKVTGNVNIEAGKVEHRYLILTLLSGGTYEVRGMKDGSTETSVVIPANHYDGKVITSIAGSAFSGKIAITELTIGENVTSIGNRAFYNCTALTRIEWNAVSVEDFTGGIYSNSDHNLIFYKAGTYGDGIEVIFGDNVESIPAYCFCPSGYSSYYAPKITSVVIGNSVTSIGESAFDECTSLTSVDFLGSIDQWASISFGDYDSNPCEYSKSLKIQGNLISEATINVDISAYAFYYVQNLTKVTLTENVKIIGNYAFSSCSGFTSIVIPDSVENIKRGAFRYCRELKSVVIGNSVKSIGENAFEYCSGLTSVEFLGSIDQWASINFTNRYSNPCNYSNSLKIKGELISETTINVGISAYAFYNVLNLTKVTIREGCTSIGSYAFYNCSSLSGSLVIPDSVTRIGTYAFGECSTLKELTIGDGVTRIGDDAFFKCSGLTSVIIGDGVTEIGIGAFNICSSLTSVVIGNSVMSIGAAAFQACSWLKSIVIPDSVTSIGNAAFYGCSRLTTVYYGGTLSQWTSISRGVDNSPLTSATRYYFSEKQPTGTGNYWHWEDVDGVKTPKIWEIYSITIPEGVTVKRDGGIVTEQTALYVGDELTIELSSPMEGDWIRAITVTGATLKSGSTYTVTGNVTIELGEVEHRYLTFTLLDDDTYEVKGMKSGSTETEIMIPSTHFDGKAITSIAGGSSSTGAFRSNRKITKLTIGENVTSIGSSAFEYCSGLKGELVIPDSVISIGEWAFYSCSGLTSVVIGKSVESIGSYVFYSCSGLTGELIIPDSVTSLGIDAFRDCRGLTGELVIPGSVESIGKWAFSNCSGFTSIVIKNGVKSIENSAFEYCNGLKGELVIPDSVTSIGDHAFYCCGRLTSIVIGKSVKSIGEFAFTSCSGLTGELVIPDSVESIGGSAFASCDGLTGELVIPDSVTSIGNYAFQNCDGITSIIIGNGVTSIGKSAFYQCFALRNIVIGNSVTSIGESVFYNCDFTSIVIGSSVTSIERAAFSSCRYLKEVYYGGTAEDWENINIVSTNNGTLTSATRYYFSETYPFVDGVTSGRYWHWADDGVTPEIWKATAQTTYAIGEIADGITLFKGEDASGAVLESGDQLERGEKITIHYECDDGYAFGGLTINNQSYSAEENDITVELNGELTITFTQVVKD